MKRGPGLSAAEAERLRRRRLADSVERELREARSHLATATMAVAEAVEESQIYVGPKDVVLVLPRSANRKLAPVDLVDVGMDRKRPVPRAPFCSATYIPIAQTCPDSCPFKSGGCFASSGYSGRPVRRMEANAEGLSAADIARAEAKGLDGLDRNGVEPDGGRDGKSPRDLRLHVSGDVTTPEGLDLLAGAVVRWQGRGGGSAWTFTHSWRTLPRARWRSISVLASVETPAQVEEARERGYTPALTIREFPDGAKPFKVPGAETSFIPCPAETKGATCVECRLCVDREPFLHEKNKGIAFAVHGVQSAQAKKRLPMFGTLFGTIP